VGNQQEERVKSILLFVVEHLLKLLDEELVKIGFDKLFDVIEDAVADSSTPYDDAIVLPLVAKLRALLDIPDLD